MPANDDWFRAHFPVIMETSKSYWANYDIYHQMNQDEWLFPTIEYGQAMDDGGAGMNPFTLKDKQMHLKHIMNNE